MIHPLHIIKRRVSTLFNQRVATMMIKFSFIVAIFTLTTACSTTPTAKSMVKWSQGELCSKLAEFDFYAEADLLWLAMEEVMRRDLGQSQICLLIYESQMNKLHRAQLAATTKEFHCKKIQAKQCAQHLEGI